MGNKLWIGLSFLVVFSLALSGAAASAQAPKPGQDFSRSGRGPFNPALPDSPAGSLATGNLPEWNGAAASPTAGLAPQMATGTPGLTFSHVKTFGAAEQAFFDDTQHFAYPYGVAAIGTNVWIADSDKNRAVKFDSNGVYQNFTIGKAGFREYYEKQGVSLEWILDMGVDSGGNIWVVDGGAHHVAKFNSGGVYQFSLGEQWNSGSDNDHFYRPVGIAFDASGNIYVSDRNNNRVQIFDPTGTYTATLGSYGNGNFNFDLPDHIAIYSNYLYVGDSRNHRVQIYNIANPHSIAYVATLGSTDNPGSSNSQFNKPYGVAANAGYIFVADANNNRVQLFNNSAPYAYVATIGGSCGTGNTQLCWPQDVAVDGLGNIYVADTNNQRIQQFNSSRNFVRTYGATGVPYLTDQLHYNAPSDVAVASDGSVYVSEGRGRRIVKLTADGTPVWKIGENGVSGDDNAHFGWPEGIAVGSDGRVFVVDVDNNRVQVFNSSGGYITTVGSYGSGSGQFENPQGVAVDKNGYLYVADSPNCRVEIFNSSYAFTASFGSCGSGNSQFSWARAVAVDSTGRIYVVDTDAQVVKLFDSSRNYLRSIGTGTAGNQYDRLSNPMAVEVDAQDRVYIADSWGGYIKVYDKDGKFLNILQNGSGSFQGMFRQGQGFGLDAWGNLYLADLLSHQVKRFAPGAYQGWQQVNVAGFGSRYNWGVEAMTVFSNSLFAATGSYSGIGAEIYRYQNGDWVQVMSSGFGDPYNNMIDSFEQFGDQLYAGTVNQWYDNAAGKWKTNGAQIWRSPTAASGSWTKAAEVGIGSVNNAVVGSLRAYDGYLYAGTTAYDVAVAGAEIYRSASGDYGTWSKVFDDSVPLHDKSQRITAMEVFSGSLYAGTDNWNTGGAELWRTADGTTWTQVNLDGFGDANNRRILSLAEFNGKLYAGVQNYDNATSASLGAQVWRSGDGTIWEKVVDGGFGDIDNYATGSLIVYRGQLYALADNYHYADENQTKGIEVWRTDSGGVGSWKRIGFHSLGGEIQAVDHWKENFTIYNDRLYLGTQAWYLAGGRIFAYQPETIFLPVTIRR